MSSSKLESGLCSVLQVVAERQNVSMSTVSVDLNSTETHSFFSESYKGIIKRYDDGKIISVAIRIISNKEDEVDLQYENENNVYFQVFSILDTFQEEKQVKMRFDNIPKFYCKVVTKEGEKMQYIAIQDLKSLNYCVMDKNTPFVDDKHMKMVFQILGKFHAQSFALKDQCVDKYKKSVNSLLDSTKTYCSLLQLIENNVLAGLKAFDEINDADIISKLQMVKNVNAILNNALEYSGPYKCIIHGNCWSNNMLFKYKDCNKLEDMKLANFHMTRESTPIIDLSLFFYSGASANDFKKIDEYLETYYQSFYSFIKELGSDPDKIYPYEAFKTEWKTYGIVGALLAIDLGVSKYMDSKDFLKLRNLKGSQKGVLEKLETELQKHRDSEGFKKRARDIFLHLIEYEMI